MPWVFSVSTKKTRLCLNVAKIIGTSYRKSDGCSGGLTTGLPASMQVAQPWIFACATLFMQRVAHNHKQCHMKTSTAHTSHSIQFMISSKQIDLCSNSLRTTFTAATHEDKHPYSDTALVGIWQRHPEQTTLLATLIGLNSFMHATVLSYIKTTFGALPDRSSHCSASSLLLRCTCSRITDPRRGRGEVQPANELQPWKTMYSEEIF